MARYLVTGGAGFIGSHVVEALLEEGETVRVLDNFSTGRPENLAQVKEKIDLIKGDICHIPTVKRASAKVDYILHLAAIPSVSRSLREPLLTNQVNIQGTLQLLEAAREAGVKRFLYASSSSVYGDRPELPRSEELEPRPRSPYSLQKLTSERYCQLYFSLYGLSTVCLRYFNVYGPRQAPGSIYSGVISRFITALLEGQPPIIYGDGEQTRDFTYVADVARATLLAAKKEEASGQVINIASGQCYRINDLVKLVQQETGRALPPRYQKPRPGDVRHSLGDIRRAKDLLGFEPRIHLQEGLRLTILWYRQLMGQP